MYSTWPFALVTTVQPVALTVFRPLPIHVVSICLCDGWIILHHHPACLLPYRLQPAVLVGGIFGGLFLSHSHTFMSGILIHKYSSSSRFQHQSNRVNTTNLCSSVMYDYDNNITKLNYIIFFFFLSESHLGWLCEGARHTCILLFSHHKI